MEVIELASTEQEIHAVVTLVCSNSTWLLSAVYGSPRFEERRLLWENLIAVSGLHSLPWVITGGFNEVLMDDDKFGGHSANISRALIFQECLDTCRIIDIGYSRARFTYQPPPLKSLDPRKDRPGIY